MIEPSFAQRGVNPYLGEELGDTVRVKRFTHKFESTAASGATITLLGGRIDDGTYIVRTSLHVEDTVVSVSDNTISAGCVADGDLFTAADLTDTAENTLTAGAVTGFSNEIYVSANCAPYLKIGSGTTGVTAGEISVNVELFPKTNPKRLQ